MNGEDYLAVIGGGATESSSNNAPKQPKQPGADYSDLKNNEIHFYKISSGQYSKICTYNKLIN